MKKTRWFVAIISLLILNSCKKDISSTSTNAQSRLANNNDVLNKNGLVFASSNGIMAGTSTAFPNNIGGEGFVGLNWDPNKFGSAQIFCYAAGHQLVGLYITNSSIATPSFSNLFYSRTGVTFWNGLSTPCDFSSANDKVVAYDMYGTGRLDHLICYRPGTGKIWIFHWEPKGNIIWYLDYYSTIGVGNAGSNFDLTNTLDEIIPFDFNHTGKATGLMCYRPGTGKIMVFTNSVPDHQTPNYTQMLNTPGIGSGAGAFNLMGTMDLVIPWDVSHTGNQDGILAYRTGGGIIATYTHIATNNFFTNAQYSSNGITAGSNNYDLRDPAQKDRIIHYKTPSGRFGVWTGALVTRAGKKLAYSYSNLDVNQNTLLTASGSGIGDPSNPSKYYDLSSPIDQVAAFDGLGIGYPNCLLCWRPGMGAFWIFVGDFEWVY